MTDSDDNDLKMASRHSPLRVDISGVDDEDLARLLEDTAKYIRSSGSKIPTGSARDIGLEAMFRRVDLGDFVIVSVRS